MHPQSKKVLTVFIPVDRRQSKKPGTSDREAPSVSKIKPGKITSLQRSPEGNVQKQSPHGPEQEETVLEPNDGSDEPSDDGIETPHDNLKHKK